MSLANVRVTNAQELEDAVSSLFERALNQVHFCDAYADVCGELEAKCSQALTRSSMWDGLVYLSIQDSPPRLVSGPFFSRAAARQTRDRELDEAPANLSYDSRFNQGGELFKIWKDQAGSSYYVSPHIVLQGPYASRDTAEIATEGHPVRTVLLRCCQRELGVNSKQKMRKADAEKVKQRKLGTCHFPAALLRRGIVEVLTLHRCMEVLLDVRQNIAGELELLNPHVGPDKDNLEALCTLLESESIGERLESQSKDPLVSKYYWVLKGKLNGRTHLPPELASRVQAVIDLRANRWDANSMEKKKARKEIAQLFRNKRARTE